MAENAGDPRKVCLEFLVSRMHELQSGLSEAYRNDEIFRNKLLNAVKNVDASKLAYYKPADSFEGLVSDLYSLAVETTPASPAVDAHFLNRHYRGKSERYSNTHDSGGNKQHNLGRSRDNLRCIVFHKEICWSTKHFKEERISALRRNERVRQFVTDVENKKSEHAEDRYNDDDDDADDEQIISELENSLLTSFKSLLNLCRTTPTSEWISLLRRMTTTMTQLMPRPREVP